MNFMKKLQREAETYRLSSEERSVLRARLDAELRRPTPFEFQAPRHDRVPSPLTAWHGA